MQRRFLTTMTLLWLALFALSAYGETPGAIDESLLKQFSNDLDAKGPHSAVINAVTGNSIKSLSLNRALLADRDNLFNIKIKGTDIINQRSTGRCWMFAGVNVVAPKVMTKLKLSDFELSEAYLAFFDKMEKSNRFLEYVIASREKPLDDRSLQMYIESPLGDGGWWHYFIGLISKYGVVPTSAMPETKQSSATGSINRLATSLLRGAAADIRRMHADGKPEKDLRAYKEEVLSDLYRLLVCGYGKPPTEFTFRYESKEDSVTTIHEQTFTPKAFFNEFYGSQLPEYVALVHNPAKEYRTRYLLAGGRNIEEDSDLSVLNMPVERLKYYALKSLIDSQTVWFACDVGKDNLNDSGLFAVNIYDYNATFGMDFTMSKADRINFMDMSPNHAMVLTGADTTSDGSTRKWLVENSWGKKKGDDGFWTMYDTWFDEYVLLVIIDKRMIESDEAALLEQEPVVIEDWEPFFAALQHLQNPLLNF